MQEYIGLLEGQEIGSGGEEIKTLRERARMYREVFGKLWPDGEMPSVLAVAARWPTQTRLVNMHLLAHSNDAALPRGLRDAVAQIRTQEQFAYSLWKRKKDEGVKRASFLSPWHPATLKGAAQRSAALDGFSGADGWADEVDE